MVSTEHLMEPQVSQQVNLNMLGLGNNISTSAVTSEFSILNTSPDLWLQFDTGQTTPDIDADGDTDNKWADSSGNNNHATQTVDAYEGTFVDGDWSSGNNQDFLNLTSNVVLTDAFTIFFVFVFEGTNDTFIGSSTGDFMRFGHGNNPTLYKSRFGGSTANAITITSPTTNKALYRVERNASDKLKITQNSNSVLVTDGALNEADFTFNKIPAGSFGLSDKYFSEMVIFNRALTSSETASIEADILTRTSLTAD